MVELAVVQGQEYASYPTAVYVDEVSVGSSSGGANRSILPVILLGR